VKMQRQLHVQSEGAEQSVAQAARQHIYSLIQNIHQQEEVLRPSDAGRERRVWVDIVRYANADLSTDTKAYGSFLRVLYELTPTPDLTEFKLAECREAGDFFCLSELGGARKSDLISLAVHYQKALKNLLLWLCRPKSHPELRLDAIRFLEVNARGADWHIDYREDPIADSDDIKEGRCPFLYFVKQVKFASIMSPICEFIFEFADDPPKLLPIRVCKRPGCDKFLVPERIGRKEYCSPKCCSSDHRPTPEENKDYIWLYRLTKIKSDGTLRRRLRENPETMKRFRELETRWKKEPKFVERIEHVRARTRL
jgi:hypothetical protein